MPKIANLKQINGIGFCVVLNNIPSDEDGAISIYTEKEIEQLKRDVALAISDKVLNMYPKPSR